MKTKVRVEEKDVVGHHRGHTYLLTFGLPDKVDYLKQLGVHVAFRHDHPFFTQVRNDLSLKFQRFFPHAKIRSIDARILAQDILDRARQVEGVLTGDTVVVSTCPDIVCLENGLQIEVNRLINDAGAIIGIGPRPSCNRIDVQASRLYELSNHRDIVLVEDGTFTGSTLLYLLNVFGRSLKAVVVGIAFVDAIQTINEKFHGSIDVVEEMSDFIDWMPDHDFFPFLPHCGRVVGVAIGFNEGALPVTLDELPWSGTGFSVPYLMPFLSEEQMSNWTSIPRQECWDFSAYCLDRSIELFEIITESNGGRDIRVSDLVKNSSRICYPIRVGHRPKVIKNVPVLEILHRSRRELDAL